MVWREEGEGKGGRGERGREGRGEVQKVFVKGFAMDDN
jgi:hypothetical protein